MTTATSVKNQRTVGTAARKSGAVFLAALGALAVLSPACANGEAAVVPASSRSAVAATSSYVVRYVCFVATPLVKRTAGESALLHPRGVSSLPASLRDLKNGVSVAEDDEGDGALSDTSSATAFVQSLAEQTPSYTFRLLATGVTDAATSGDDATVSGVSSEQAPLTVALADSVRITPDQSAPGALSLTRTGALTRLSPAGASAETVRWTGDAKNGVVPGHVYAHAIANLPGGARLVYAYSVVAAPAAERTVAAR